MSSTHAHGSCQPGQPYTHHQGSRQSDQSYMHQQEARQLDRPNARQEANLQLGQDNCCTQSPLQSIHPQVVLPSPQQTGESQLGAAQPQHLKETQLGAGQQSLQEVGVDCPFAAQPPQAYTNQPSVAQPPIFESQNNQTVMVNNVPTYLYDSHQLSQQPQGLRESGSSHAVLENGEIAPGLHRLPVVGLLCAYGIPLVALLAAFAFNIYIQAMGQTRNASSLFGMMVPFLVAFVILAAQFLVKYYGFMWGITPDGLRIKEGIIVKKDMTIPFNKIHSLHLTEPIAMRIFGFVAVKIDTGASGFQAAHRIVALHRNEAEALQRDVFRFKQLLAEGVQACEPEIGNKQQVKQGETPLDLQSIDETTRGLVERARTIHRQELTLAEASPQGQTPLTQEVVQFDQRLRGLFAGRSITDADVIAQRSLSFSELVWSALLNVKLGAGLSVIFATISFAVGLAGVQQWIDSRVGQIEQTLSSSSVSAPTPFSISLVSPTMIGIFVFITILLILVGMGVAMFQHIVTHANFNVSRTRSRINITAGLVTRHSYAIAVERIQALVVQQSLLQRLFKCATLQVVLLQGFDETSSKGSKEFKQDGKEVIHPCLKIHEIPAFLTDYLPEYAAVYQATYPMTSLPTKALSRSLKRASYWALFASALAVMAAAVLVSLIEQAPLFSVHKSALAGVALIVLGVVFGLQVLPRYLKWKQTKIGRSDHALCVIKGIFELKRVLLYREKIQEIMVAQNPFQLRLDLARVCYKTAGQSVMSSGDVYDVSLECAHDIYEWLRPQTHNDKLVTFALEQAGMNQQFVPQQP